MAPTWAVPGLFLLATVFKMIGCEICTFKQWKSCDISEGYCMYVYFAVVLWPSRNRIFPAVVLGAAGMQLKGESPT